MGHNVVHPQYSRDWPELRSIDPALRVRFVPCFTYAEDDFHNDCEHHPVTYVPMCNRWVLETKVDGGFYDSIGWSGEPFEYALICVLERAGQPCAPDNRLLDRLREHEKVTAHFCTSEEEARFRAWVRQAGLRAWYDETGYVITSARKLWQRSTENPFISFRPATRKG